MDKKALRKEMLKIRDTVDIQCRNKWSSDIAEKVLHSDAFQKSGEVLIYCSYKSEVDTHGIIKASLEQGKKVFCPLVDGKEMNFFRIEKFGDLRKGFRDIYEPENCFENNWNFLHRCGEKSLMIMPGVVFDKSGNRIGYGGGFYDRFLERYRKETVSIALAFDKQIVDKITADAYDIRPDYIFTESHSYISDNLKNCNFLT